MLRKDTLKTIVRTNLDLCSEITKEDKEYYTDLIVTDIMEYQSKEILGNLVFTCDKFEQYMSAPSKWQESVCMTLKLKPEQLKAFFKDFMKIKKLEGDNGASWATPQEAQTHFLNWIRKQPVPQVSNAPSKKVSSVITPEDKYNAFIGHIKTHKSIPANADWIPIYEYAIDNNKFNQQHILSAHWSDLSYMEKINLAKPTLIDFAYKNFTISDANKYNGVKQEGTGLSNHIQQLKDSLT